jgi:hypothetical protein
MEAAGDIGRGDERHQLVIVRAAFTQVAVQVEVHVAILDNPRKLRHL